VPGIGAAFQADLRTPLWTYRGGTM